MNPDNQIGIVCILGRSECRIPNQFLQALEELSR
eukprot:COSAG02_NODE_23897_length_704_cov_1.705785_2_plen_33_part_01